SSQAQPEAIREPWGQVLHSDPRPSPKEARSCSRMALIRRGGRGDCARKTPKALGMVTCPSCGQENPDGARFCNACAAPLAAPSPPREERKVVTVLFADLVGFTARAERLDPEDVRALLAPYHERLRSELERFGGTVE